MEGAEDFLAKHGNTFPECGGLGRDVVGACGDHQIAPLGGARGKASEDGDGLISNHFEGSIDLKLFHVFGQVARGHAFVNVLMSGQVIKFFNTGFDIVAGDALSFVDRREIDLIFH